MSKSETMATKQQGQARLERLESLRLFSLRELETIIGVTHRSLLTYVKQGKLKAHKVAGMWRVSEEQVRAFINGDTARGAQA